jgi:glycosyl transferase family 87
VSTLVNPTWWLLCVAVVVCAGARDHRRALPALLRRGTGTVALLAFGAAATLNVGARALLGHAVPGDFVQEVVGSESVANGSSLYPEDVNAAVGGWLRQDPPVIPRWLPRSVQQWLLSRQLDGRNRLVAQAHPPTLLAAFTPAVVLFGPYGAYWELTCISVGAAVLAALLIVSQLAPQSTTRVYTLAVLAVLSWQPTLAAIRDGQASVLIGALLVAAWGDLRRERDRRAGIWLGVATALKLYPVVLVAWVAVRRPRAFVTAVLTIVAAVGIATLAVGPSEWVKYVDAGGEIVTAFASVPYNLSLLARLAALIPGSILGAMFFCVAVCMMAVTFLGIPGRIAPAHGEIDRDAAAFVTLALLLSPVAWHHYVFMLLLPLAVVGLDVWKGGRRPAMIAICVLALILSAPDDVWRGLWWRMPPRLGLLLSPPAVAAVILWFATLRGPTRPCMLAGDGPIVPEEPQTGPRYAVHPPEADSGRNRVTYSRMRA